MSFYGVATLAIFYHPHHPAARAQSYGKGLRSRVKRKRAARRHERDTPVFAVTFYRTLDGRVYRDLVREDGPPL
jgi:hypothetical protein